MLIQEQDQKEKNAICYVEKWSENQSQKCDRCICPPCHSLGCSTFLETISCLFKSSVLNLISSFLQPPKSDVLWHLLTRMETQHLERPSNERPQTSVKSILMKKGLWKFTQNTQFHISVILNKKNSCYETLIQVLKYSSQFPCSIRKEIASALRTVGRYWTALCLLV